MMRALFFLGDTQARTESLVRLFKTTRHGLQDTEYKREQVAYPCLKADSLLMFKKLFYSTESTLIHGGLVGTRNIKRSCRFIQTSSRTNWLLTLTTSDLQWKVLRLASIPCHRHWTNIRQLWRHALRYLDSSWRKCNNNYIWNFYTRLKERKNLKW